MKKRCGAIAIGVITIVVVILVIRIFVKNDDMSEADSSQDNEIQQQLEADIMMENTKISNAIEEKVDITVEAISEEELQVYVEAPNISESLIGWVEKKDEAIDETELEEKIVDLIQEEIQSGAVYELSYDEQNMHIYYTEDYINAVTCGLYEFYDYAMNQVIMEMLEEEGYER